jgi:hypothetical protein
MDQVEPFTEFLTRTANARPEQYAEAISAAAQRHGLSVERVAAEFERMKNYILSYYEGIRPVCSFLNASGQPVDCIPFEQQPSVRAAHAAGYPTEVTPPTPAPTPGISLPTDVEPLLAPVSGSSLPPDATRPPDSASPASSPRPIQIPPGTVPLLRVTLNRMIQLGTFESFFRKAVGLPEGRMP